MQKIVVDTNVIISSLIQRGFPFFIVNHLFLKHKIVVCISEELLEEYNDVISRPKFLKFPDFSANSEALIADVEKYAVKYSPTSRIELIKDDDDNRLLELADESSADFIITGNTKDFTFSFYKRTRIVTPKEYWENYRPMI